MYEACLGYEISVGLQLFICMQLENLILKGIAEAKRNIQAQKRERALLYLRKNKVYDHSLKNIDDYLLNVEQASPPQVQILLNYLVLYIFPTDGEPEI